MIFLYLKQIVRYEYENAEELVWTVKYKKGDGGTYKDLPSTYYGFDENHRFYIYISPVESEDNVFKRGENYYFQISAKYNNIVSNAVTFKLNKNKFKTSEKSTSDFDTDQISFSANGNEKTIYYTSQGIYFTKDNLSIEWSSQSDKINQYVTIYDSKFVFSKDIATNIPAGNYYGSVYVTINGTKIKLASERIELKIQSNNSGNYVTIGDHQYYIEKKQHAKYVENNWYYYQVYQANNGTWYLCVYHWKGYWYKKDVYYVYSDNKWVGPYNWY